MSKLRVKFQKIKASYLQVAGVLLMIILAACLVWFGNSTSWQAEPSLMDRVYFDGEYRIGNGEWQKIQKDEHIPSTKGDVTLRGNFHKINPLGEYDGIYTDMIPIALYANHISLTVYEEGLEPEILDMENPAFRKSNCGVSWESYVLKSNSEAPIEIVIHNPHGFGNENAVDELISGITLWNGIDFEKEALSRGDVQRNVGLLLMLASIVFLGIALFSSLIHVKNNKIIWLLGLVVLCAGVFFSYHAKGVSFWSESIVSNTTILGCAMMLYMLFLLGVISCFLKTTKAIGTLTVFVLATVDAVLFALPIVSDVYFYDTWAWWVLVQLALNGVLAACLLREFFAAKKKEIWFYAASLLPLIAFAVDVAAAWLGFMKSGTASQYVFLALFVAAIVAVLKLIPQNINAATKARELELERTMLHAQLAESRISTMMSQIRPHFIYNTLGSIEQLCKLDPPKAGELVHNFAKYLRGNFGELDNPRPILMSQEMAHVHHYVSIENVRFPDMTFTFEMNSADFKIPALTVQPIVENAIKHGLMKLARGGTIRVVSYETDVAYCISVEDNGVGFDTGAEMDERGHVGLRNIRERLKVMVNGALEIESTPGVGTKVVITIPKEAYK